MEEVGGVTRLEALINQRLQEWEAAECPLCREGVPVNTEVGHGREFLAQK